MDRNLPSMLKPTLVSGALFGALAGLPYLDVMNICTCCSFIIVCGFVASFLYSGQCRAAGIQFKPGTGALVGLIAAAFYAVVQTVVEALSQAVVGPVGALWLIESMLGFLQGVPDAPAESLDRLEDLLDQMNDEQQVSPFSIVWSFFTSMLIGAAFSTIGGLIGGVVFKVEAAPPAPPAPPGPSALASYSEPDDPTPGG